MKEKELREAAAERFGITALNEIQEAMLRHGAEKRDIILLSPTGSGKTIAFTLPLLKLMRPSTGRVQAVIVAPSRELVTQIAGVIRQLARGFRVLGLYGGHSVEDEVNSLQVVPDIVVATPGRLLDHARRDNIDLTPVRLLVLDEFDKILEAGFEEEMGKIVRRLKNVSRTILTSATKADTLPDFLRLDNPVIVDYLGGNEELRGRMRLRSVRSDGRDKLVSLLSLLRAVGIRERVIVFVNHRESAERVYDFLRGEGVSAVLYHGALDQRQRESALALFNSGARPILVATDLAGRGLDIADVGTVIHYHQPLTAEMYAHRNGRTARVARSGDIYLLLGPDEEMKDFVEADGETTPEAVAAERPEGDGSLRSGFEALYIGAGRREKLSRGDILGFLTKEAGLQGSEVGKIEVFDHYAIVAVASGVAKKALISGREKKIKGEKRRVSLIS